MKRVIVSMLLIAGLAVAAFATGQTEQAATGERQTLTVWVNNGPPEVPMEETQVWPYFQEVLSADVEFEYTVGEAAQRAGVILASGDLPDAIATENRTMEMFVESKQYIDLADYIRNSQELPGSYPQDYIDAHFAREDGVVPYLSNGVPEQATPDPPGGGWWMQLRVLRWAGWPEKFTFDEYIDTLRGFAEEFPETNGQPTISYIFQNRTWQLDTLTNPPAELQGKVDGGGFWFDDVNGRWVPQIVTGTPAQRRFLVALNDLYNDNLLDEESFVHSPEQYQAKLAEGRFLGGYGYSYQLGPPREALREQGLLDHAWVPVAVTYEEDQVPPHRVQTQGQGIIGGFAIMPTTPDPDLAWQTLVEDWLSDEALTLNGWGLEGVHYEVDSSGKFYMTDEELDNWLTLKGPERDRFYMRLAGGRHLPYHSSLLPIDAAGNVENPNYDPEIVAAKYVNDPLWNEYITAYGVTAPGEVFEIKTFPSHGWTWNISREDEVGVAYENWDEFRRRWYPRLLLAAPGQFNTVWNNYLDAIDDIQGDIDLWMERADYVGNYRKETNNPNANP